MRHAAKSPILRGQRLCIWEHPWEHKSQDRRNAAVYRGFVDRLEGTPSSIMAPYPLRQIRTGGSKGVRPLHGVTGATRRREGVAPSEVFLRATSKRCARTATTAQFIAVIKRGN